MEARGEDAVSAAAEKRPTAGERAKRLMERAWQHERHSQEDFAAQEIEAAERAAREEALEDAARKFATDGWGTVAEMLRALKDTTPPPAPPPPQVSAPAQAWPTTPLEMIDGRVAEHFLGHELNRIHPLEDRIAELEAAVGRHEHRLQPRPASEVERARADVVQAVRILCGDWNRGAKVGDMAELINNLARKLDRLDRLDAAKGGAA